MKSLARNISRSIFRRITDTRLRGGGVVANPAYQILVKTDNAGTSTDTQFTLPATGTYDIDWGDGTVEEKTGAATHTYSSAGNYVIKVTGGLTRIHFANGGDKLKLLEVQNWGDATWSSFNGAYFGCANCLFNATDALVLPADCTSAFFNCTVFNQSVDNFDTAAVTTMSFMFFGCTAFNQSVASFNTAAVTNMQLIFQSCTAFKQSLATFSLVGLDATTGLIFFAFGTNINAASTTTNYDATLIAWAAQLPLDFTQSPDFGTAKYSAGAAATARAELVTAGWTITDGGEAV